MYTFLVLVSLQVLGPFLAYAEMTPFSQVHQNVPGEDQAETAIVEKNMIDQTSHKIEYLRSLQWNSCPKTRTWNDTVIVEFNVPVDQDGAADPNVISNENLVEGFIADYNGMMAMDFCDPYARKVLSGSIHERVYRPRI